MRVGPITTWRRGILAFAAICGLTAALDPVAANCFFPRRITSIPGGFYHSYISTPGYVPVPNYSSSVSPNLRGHFWMLGRGDPTPHPAGEGLGIDNGSFEAVQGYGGFYYNGWVTFEFNAFYAYPAYISSTWAMDQGIDGCPDSVNDVKCMAVLLTDQDFFENAYFAFINKLADNFGDYEFNRPGNLPIFLTAMPVPIITSVSGGGTTELEVVVEGPRPGDLTSGLYLDPSCAVYSDAIGYKVRSRAVPPGELPLDRSVESWDDVTPGGGLQPLGSIPTVRVTCTEPSDVYLAISLVFEGGFETLHVSADSSRLECPCEAFPGDDDGDGVVNLCDNCPLDGNPGQADADGDGIGDVCDVCPFDAEDDLDGDGVCGDLDNCPIENPGQEDFDGDNVGDVCDNCPATPNASQLDSDADGAGDACDICPFDFDDDADTDGICGDVDNCPGVANAEQEDKDFDGFGDVCDNCLFTGNPMQTDTDGDGFGDVCDNCANTPGDQTDTDGDSLGDVCDCAPLDPLQQPPGEVVDVRLQMIDAVTVRISWPAVPNTLTYSVSREQLESLSATNLGPCASSGDPSTEFDDPLLPPGTGFFYLVKAEGCGSGTVGADSTGTERINAHPGACP